MATLSDVLRVIEDLDDELTIYAVKPWTRESQAYVGTDPEVADPARPPKMEYLLEVDLAQEVVEVWGQGRGGREPTLEERCDAVIYYAVYDAYLLPE